MTVLWFDDGLAQDVERLVAHMLAHEVQGVAGRVGEIFDALELLARHPMIGRRAEGALRDLVIGEGSRGYVARYRYDELDDVVVVLGLRSQREAGFADR